LTAGGRPTLPGHWSDTVFVRLRRLMGLRTELLVLMVAEVVALRYYRALRDGTTDPLTREVAARILADEERHVPFHCERLHTSLTALPRPLRRPLMTLWRLLLLTAALVVATDHGRALHHLGVPRHRFVSDVRASSGSVVRAVLAPGGAFPVADAAAALHRAVHAPVGTQSPQPAPRKPTPPTWTGCGRWSTGAGRDAVTRTCTRTPSTPTPAASSPGARTSTATSTAS